MVYASGSNIYDFPALAISDDFRRIIVAILAGQAPDVADLSPNQLIYLRRLIDRSQADVPIEWPDVDDGGATAERVRELRLRLSEALGEKQAGNDEMNDTILQLLRELVTAGAMTTHRAASLSLKYVGL